MEDDNYIEQLIAKQRQDLEALVHKKTPASFEYSPDVPRDRDVSDEERLVKEWQEQWELRRQKVKVAEEISPPISPQDTSTDNGSPTSNIHHSFALSELDSPFQALRHSHQESYKKEAPLIVKHLSHHEHFSDEILKAELEEEKAKRQGAETALSEVLDELDEQRRIVSRAEKSKGAEMVAREHETTVNESMRNELNDMVSYNISINIIL